jgi:hypothetical protein
MNKIKITLASCLLGGSILLLGAVLYLYSVFPRTVQIWMDAGRQLTAAEQFMV